MTLETLTNDDLRKRLLALASRERESTADLVRHLAEADVRRASDEWGYASLFFYCTEELRLSEAAAYKRINVARLGLAYPVIFDLLKAGDTHLEGLLIIGSHLTPENHRPVLERIRRKSKRGIELIAAELAPLPDAPDSIRKLPDRAAAPLGNAAATPEANAPASSAPVRVGRADVTVPLSPKRYYVSFTADAALVEKLERVQALIRARRPGARLEDALAAMADLYLNAEDPDLAAARRHARRLAKGEALPPVKPEASAGDRRAQGLGRRPIPRAVQDAVRLRDGGRCTSRTKDGRRCTARAGLQFDHIRPVAEGGRSDDPGNLRLLCAAHNAYEARLRFGEALVGPHRRGAVGRGRGGRRPAQGSLWETGPPS